MRTRLLLVPVVAALVLVAAGLFVLNGVVPAQTAPVSNLGQSRTTLGSTTSANYPSRAFLTIVGSAGNGDDAYFAPANLTVAVNATVIWTNEDRSVVHNVVSTGSTSFSSGDISPGTTWSLTLTKPGTYTYFCSYHPWMTGSVVVVGKAAGG